MCNFKTGLHSACYYWNAPRASCSNKKLGQLITLNSSYCFCIFLSSLALYLSCIVAGWRRCNPSALCLLVSFDSCYTSLLIPYQPPHIFPRSSSDHCLKAWKSHLTNPPFRFSALFLLILFGLSARCVECRATEESKSNPSASIKPGSACWRAQFPLLWGFLCSCIGALKMAELL